MSNLLSLRTLVRVGVVAGFVVWLWQLSGRAEPFVPASPQKPITITTTQLPSADAIVPVSLQCQTLDHPQPTGGKALRCIVTNNTNIPITAVSLAYNLKLEEKGEQLTQGGFVTIDALVHPDFHDANFSKFILPGAERVIVSRRLIDEPAPDATTILVGIDYAEFDNGTRLGPNKNGSQVVKQIRDGAVRYKEWLKQKYLTSGRSISAINQILERTTPVGPDLGIEGDLEIGAKEYRRSARQVIKFFGGPSEIKKYLAK